MLTGGVDMDALSCGLTTFQPPPLSVATNTLAGILPAAIPVGQVEDAYPDNLYRQFGDSWRWRIAV